MRFVAYLKDFLRNFILFIEVPFVFSKFKQCMRSYSIWITWTLESKVDSKLFSLCYKMRKGPRKKKKKKQFSIKYTKPN